MSAEPVKDGYRVHRLASLVLLTRRKNSEAGNREFAVKKSGYFTGRSGGSPFVLTTQVIAQQTWTPNSWCAGRPN